MSRELENYNEMNNQMNSILPKHKKFTHRFLNGLTKRVFGTSHLYTEGLISFFRSIIRLNYYKCIGNYQNNQDIKNISNYCKNDEKNIFFSTWITFNGECICTSPTKNELPSRDS